jgi:signal peptidase I
MKIKVPSEKIIKFFKKYGYDEIILNPFKNYLNRNNDILQYDYELLFKSEGYNEFLPVVVFLNGQFHNSMNFMRFKKNEVKSEENFLKAFFERYKGYEIGVDNDMLVKIPNDEIELEFALV